MVVAVGHHKQWMWDKRVLWALRDGNHCRYSRTITLLALPSIKAYYLLPSAESAIWGEVITWLRSLQPPKKFPTFREDSESLWVNFIRDPLQPSSKNPSKIAQFVEKPANVFFVAVILCLRNLQPPATMSCGVASEQRLVTKDVSVSSAILTQQPTKRGAGNHAKLFRHALIVQSGDGDDTDLVNKVFRWTCWPLLCCGTSLTQLNCNHNCLFNNKTAPERETSQRSSEIPGTWFRFGPSRRCCWSCLCLSICS